MYDMFTVEDEGVDGYNQVGADYGNACIPADPGYKILAFKTKGCKESDCNGPPEPDNE